MDETLKPCPFCGGEADYHSEKGPTGEVYGWVGCNQCDAMSCHTDTRSMQPEETHPIDAWNTRADAAPTPKADEVEAVARAIEDQLTAEDGWMVGTPALSSMCHDFALAAIAALDAARGDPVARVVDSTAPFAWATRHDPPMLFLLYDDARLYCDDDEKPIPLYELERGEPFNG